MADLKSMFGKPKAVPVVQEKAGANLDTAEAVASEATEADADSRVEISPASEKVAAKPGFAFAKKPDATPSQAPTESKPKPALAGLKLPGSGAVAGKSVQAPKADSLDDFANMDLSDVDTALPGERSRFADETPATKPTRELPEGLEKQQLQFVDLLDGMYEIVGDPELLGNVVKSMMIELKANPQYEKLLSPSDIRLVVKAARESMGIARVKKTEEKAKRGSGGSKASKVVDADMMADLDSLGISFD